MRFCIFVFGYLLFTSQAFAEDSPDSREFKQELFTVEQKVNGLKERVFQSKATLKLLNEIIIQGSVSGSRSTIWHVNDLGNGYIIESVSYFLDGKGKYANSDSGGLLRTEKEFKVFDDSIPSGSHTLSVNLKLRGNGYGVFKYVNKYTFDVQSSSVFTAQEGEDCQLRVIIKEKAGIGHSFFERPQVEFEPRCRQMSDVVE
jgi:hypothetical protein